MRFNGNPSVGAFIASTDTYVLVPQWVRKPTITRLKTTLQTEVIPCSLGGSNLLGVFAAGNTKGLVVPHFTDERELALLRSKLEIPVEKIPSKLTALGNIVLVNDHGAIIHKDLEKPASSILQKVLQVPVKVGTIAKSPLVGSAGVVTNRGLLVHPMVTDLELEALGDYFKVIADVGTVMHGSPFVGIGLSGNIYGIITSSETTGPELARISQTFDIQD